jgi:DNA replication and repair protein RecF
MTSKTTIQKLSLHNFRNFEKRNFAFEAQQVVIAGKNGIGKTNILEAISLLAPGRGLRNAKLDDIETLKNPDKGWSVQAKILIDDVDLRTITTLKDDCARRKIIIDDKKTANQAHLLNVLNVVWLTPLMDMIFVGSASDRRHFFDNIVANLYPDHIKDLARYHHYIKERLKILLQSPNQDSWILAVENKIVELISSIAHARVEVLGHLNNAISELHETFPKAQLTIEGKYENMVAAGKSALEIEKIIASDFATNRQQDFATGRTNIGTHKSDLVSFYKKRNILAKICSTGEQKSMLISIILGKARMIYTWTNKPPIILLDEINSHLDEYNRDKLLQEIHDMGSQCFMTGTDANSFSTLKNDAEFIDVTT